MSRSITLVEINIFERMLPLVSGYLQAYACADSHLRKTYRFDKYTTTISTPLGQLVNELSEKNSSIYAFSCYLWNMGLIKSLLPALLEATPDAHVLLGGPQVMRHAHEYLDPAQEKLMVCNGEGERTFSRYLRELTCDKPDFSNVHGLSFYRDGSLMTTPPESRIESLDEIPSPFLNGVFDGAYRMAVMETNRGCPFRCSFCYWGAATNDRVYKFDDDRIRDEVTWLSQNGVPLLYLADANWGMLKRDVGLAEHITKCKKQRGVPFFVYFAAAKNSPKRVAEIAEVFSAAEMLNTQPISMQSLDATSLERVDRKNIKLSSYKSLQQGLNEKSISSYIELIWPLPGETLTSFKNGIENLCELKAAHLIAYPHMLLHNTPLYQKKDEYELVTRTVADSVAEAELVVQTADVSYDDFVQGLRFFYAVLALYNTNVLRRLGAYLHESKTMPYAELFSAFVEFSRQNPQNAFAQFCEQSIDGAKYYEVSNYPTIYHIVLHGERNAFDELLYRFASSQAWWQDDRARFLFELDMLTKPYIYTNTPVTEPPFPIERVRVLEISDRSLLVQVPERLASLVEATVGPNAGPDVPKVPDVEQASFVYRVDHGRAQHPFRAEQSREENASYCSGAMMRIGDILPTLTRVSGAPTAGIN